VCIGNPAFMAGIQKEMKMKQWDFGIADLTFRLEGPENWLSPLEKAWSNWHSETDAQSWILKIKTDPEMTEPVTLLFEAESMCQDGMCTLKAQGFDVRLDSQLRCGEMIAHPVATAADVAYFLRVAVALHAFAQGAMLFHAACVVHREKGYLLFGLSGSGKTTAAKLSGLDPVLNDDLLLLWPANERWLVYSTPFGKRRGTRMIAPLQAALRLLQDQEVFLEPLSQGRALTELVANTPIISADRVLLPELMTRWIQFMDQVPVCALHFRKDPTFWEVIDAEWD
jgi:hypothetical protein